METINTALRQVQRGETVTEGRLGMIPMLDPQPERRTISR